MSPALIALLAVASGAAVANLYYAQPLLHVIAGALRVGAGRRRDARARRGPGPCPAVRADEPRALVPAHTRVDRGAIAPRADPASPDGLRWSGNGRLHGRLDLAGAAALPASVLL